MLSQLSYRPIAPVRNAIMVGLGRVELPTSPLSGARSDQLSYRPSRRLFVPTARLPQSAVQGAQTGVRSPAAKLWRPVHLICWLSKTKKPPKGGTGLSKPNSDATGSGRLAVHPAAGRLMK